MNGAIRPGLRRVSRPSASMWKSPPREALPANAARHQQQRVHRRRIPVRRKVAARTLRTGPGADGRAAAARAARRRAQLPRQGRFPHGRARPPDAAPLGPDRAVHLHRHPARSPSGCCAMRRRGRSRPTCCGTARSRKGGCSASHFTGEWFEVGDPAGDRADRGGAGGWLSGAGAASLLDRRAPRVSPMRWSPGWCRATPSPSSAWRG